MINKKSENFTEQDLIDMMKNLWKEKSENPRYIVVNGLQAESIKKEHENYIKWNEDLFSPKGLYIIGVLK